MLLHTCKPPRAGARIIVYTGEGAYAYLPLTHHCAPIIVSPITLLFLPLCPASLCSPSMCLHYCVLHHCAPPATESPITLSPITFSSSLLYVSITVSPITVLLLPLCPHHCVRNHFVLIIVSPSLCSSCYCIAHLCAPLSF